MQLPTASACAASRKAHKGREHESTHASTCKPKQQTQQGNSNRAVRAAPPLAAAAAAAQSEATTSDATFLAQNSYRISTTHRSTTHTTRSSMISCERHDMGVLCRVQVGKLVTLVKPKHPQEMAAFICSYGKQQLHQDSCWQSNPGTASCCALTACVTLACTLRTSLA